MKKIFLVLLLSLLYIVSFSQNILYIEGFESYSAGSKFVAQVTNGWWRTWDGSTGGNTDPFVVTDSIHTGINAIGVVAENDFVLNLDDKTTENYLVSFYMYVPAGYTAYYNIQHQEALGTEWAFECNFFNNGSGSISVNNTEIPFTYLMGNWIYLEHYIDLDQDSITLFIDYVKIQTWKFSMQTSSPNGTKQLGAINFFGNNNYGTATFYIDDISYTKCYAVSFFITDSESDTIENATVICNEDTVTTNINGIANFGLADGEYEYTVTAPGYKTIINTINIVSDSIINIQLNRLYYVIFNITDGTGPVSYGNIICDGDTFMIDGTGTSYASLTAGEHIYTVTVTGYEDYINTITVTGTTGIINVIMQKTSSINNTELEEISVYPNPVGNHIYIGGAEGVFDIYDQNGRIWLSKQMNKDNWLDVSHLPKGMYIIKINSKSLKFVKE